jgi:hypothetical protein
MNFRHFNLTTTITVWVVQFESSAAIYTDDLQKNTALTKPHTDLRDNAEYVVTKKTIRFLSESVALPLQANYLYILLHLHR